MMKMAQRHWTRRYQVSATLTFTNSSPPIKYPGPLSCSGLLCYLPPILGCGASVGCYTDFAVLPSALCYLAWWAQPLGLGIRGGTPALQH